MRNISKHFAEGSDHELSKPPENQRSNHPNVKRQHFKAILKDCKEIISQLQQQNQKLDLVLKQKEIIIAKLIEEKQDHILHMVNCNSQQLMKQIEEGLARQEKMKEGLRDIGQKYEKIIERQRAQIQKLKSYNRALRVQNSRLREMATEERKARKVGLITTTASKNQQSQINSFSFTKINHLNLQEQIEHNYSIGHYQTPEKSLKTAQSTAFPSTSLPKYQRSEQILKNKPIPQKLFSNDCLRELKSEQMEHRNRSLATGNCSQIEKVLMRVRAILAQSQDESI